MTEITNVKVYDLEECVIASRNAMRLTPPEYTKEEFKESLPRAMQLAKAGGGSGHSNFRKGIRVSFDIKYPNYLSPEMQRYGFLDIVTSSSKMHRLLAMDIDKACNEYVHEDTIELMTTLINEYNILPSMFANEGKVILKRRDGSEIVCSTLKEAQYHMFMAIISNCPLGLELFMRCSTNYEQLATIYRQRRTHRLKEDWGAWIEFIESLPYAQELIICKKDNNQK